MSTPMRVFHIGLVSGKVPGLGSCDGGFEVVANCFRTRRPICNRAVELIVIGLLREACFESCGASAPCPGSWDAKPFPGLVLTCNDARHVHCAVKGLN